MQIHEKHIWKFIVHFKRANTFKLGNQKNLENGYLNLIMFTLPTNFEGTWKTFGVAKPL